MTRPQGGSQGSLRTRRSLLLLSLSTVMATVAIVFGRVAPIRKQHPSARPGLSPIEGASKMPHANHDIGIARQIGAYSDAVEVKPNLRWLMTSGTPGLSEAGNLPGDITGQAERAWEHLVRMLERWRTRVGIQSGAMTYQYEGALPFVRHVSKLDASPEFLKWNSRPVLPIC